MTGRWKRRSAALRFILPVCASHLSACTYAQAGADRRTVCTPHSSEFARLASHCSWSACPQSCLSTGL